MDFFSSVFDTNQEGESDINDQFDFLQTTNNKNKEGDSKISSPNFGNINQSGSQLDSLSQQSSSFFNNLFSRPQNQQQERQSDNQKNKMPVDLMDELNNVESFFNINPQSKNQPNNHQSPKVTYFQTKPPIQQEPQHQYQKQPIPKVQQQNQPQKQLNNKTIIERDNDDEEQKKTSIKKGSKRKSTEAFLQNQFISTIKPSKKIKHSSDNESTTISNYNKIDLLPSVKKIEPHKEKQEEDNNAITFNEHLNAKMTGNYINDYNDMKEIIATKREEIKVLKKFPELQEKIFNATQDFNNTIPELLEKYLENYYECLNQISSLLQVDNNEIEILMAQCEEKLNNFSMKLSNLQ